MITDPCPHNVSVFPNSGTSSSSRITPALIRELRGRFSLDWNGIHGVRHWARVRYTGLLLAAETGADAAVVEYFAFLHDALRLNDDHDPWHGMRSAELAEDLGPGLVRLNARQLQLLRTACSFHSEGYTEADITVMTCWDADRLDLGRVGIEPSPRYLCTPQARQSDFIAAAYRRSIAPLAVGGAE
ncbi:hypothetical protein [Pseudohaliea sp.]|uniref:hypothetical protein n=1 Tax=Pseudohaliea sp. TaxID=2740289 RepID=UPI0032ED2669